MELLRSMQGCHTGQPPSALEADEGAMAPRPYDRLGVADPRGMSSAITL